LIPGLSKLQPRAEISQRLQRSSAFKLGHHSRGCMVDSSDSQRLICLEGWPAEMTGDYSVSITRIRRAHGSRVLSYFLLLLISYSGSAEIIHHHSLASSNNVATETSANILSESGRNSSSTNTPLERDCLVCQFQRGLSSATISVPHLVLALVIIQQHFSPALVTHDSLSAAPSRGRAPPITL